MQMRELRLRVRWNYCLLQQTFFNLALVLIFIISSTNAGLGCSSGLNEYKCQHSSKPCPLYTIHKTLIS